jgi:hypothetical protein
MVPTTKPRPKSPARTLRAQCCDDADCGAGARNRYFVGKRLTPDALRLEQRYLNERRHLINRAVHGHGVVYGFAVGAMPAASYEREAVTGRLRIGPGLAFDEAGRELVQTAIIDLPFASVLLLDSEGILVDRVDSPTGARWLLRVHYAEQDSGPVTTSDSCRCEKREWEQVCETVRFSLQQVNCDNCCAEPACELQCDCAQGPCCDDETAEKGAGSQTGCEPVRRGGCRCLCEHLTGLEPGTDCATPCKIEEDCGRVRVDLRHGVPLACVGLRGDGCGGWVFDVDVEDCGPRRLVKRNDLLFDLIRGADLTRVCAIGWAPWHRKTADWAAFVASFGSEEAGSGQNPTADYWVEFSRPVRADSVRADSFTMTVIVPEAEGGWRESLRVPIVDVRATAGGGVPVGLATRAQLVVDTAWVNDALVSARTRFGAGAEVEIEIRGDYITDCNGQQVDANARGLAPPPSGNGSPGGSFVSTFRVEPKPPKAASAQGVKS